MSNLLIHSMAEFSDLILDCLDLAEASRIVEIGAEHGGMSHFLAAFALAHGGRLTSIDPAPKADFLAWANGQSHVDHIAATSLDALPTLANVEAWVIDGDHNYYTVYHELKAIEALCGRDRRPLLAFIHDVSFPAGRRDMYYAPDQIPTDWRHAFDYEGGVCLDHDALMPKRGFRGAGSFAFATHSGGPRNGVLTAVEDVTAEASARGRNLAWAHIPAVFGLGILFDADAPWAAEVAARLAPFHDNLLLATLEENRLRNYLKVIDDQDNRAAA